MGNTRTRKIKKTTLKAYLMKLHFILSQYVINRFLYIICSILWIDEILKYGFCKKLHFYEWTFDQLNSFFIKISTLWVATIFCAARTHTCTSQLLVARTSHALVQICQNLIARTPARMRLCVCVLPKFAHAHSPLPKVKAIIQPQNLAKLLFHVKVGSRSFLGCSKTFLGRS